MRAGSEYLQNYILKDYRITRSYYKIIADIRSKYLKPEKVKYLKPEYLQGHETIQDYIILYFATNQAPKSIKKVPQVYRVILCAFGDSKAFPLLKEPDIAVYQLKSAVQ